MSKKSAMSKNAAVRKDAALRVPPRLGMTVLLFVFATGLVAQEVVEVVDVEQQAMKGAVSVVADSVVRIETIGGKERVGRVLIGTGPTTGLIVDSGGYIVSSAFNFVQHPTSILVTLPNGNRVASEIIARDHSRMIVLLKVDADSPLPVPEAVPLAEMRVGQWTLALGRTFGDDIPNLSVGILSARRRIWRRAIQTDCKVSPMNYGGPLIDIRGRVLGVLLPLSPQGGSEVAGAEWYDSGIGFAVPLVDVFAVLERLKQGEDLHRGLLGITLKGRNELEDPPILATVPAGSPAAVAGLQRSDKIVEINGTKVQTQAQLKSVLGPLYAGDRVRLVVSRKGDPFKFEVELTDKIEPYQLPFLGVLPLRNTQAGRVQVRYVYDESPAADAGIAIGDRLVSLNGNEFHTLEEWQENLAIVEKEEGITVVLERGLGEKAARKDITLRLAAPPESIPDRLPAAYADSKPQAIDAGSDDDDAGAAEADLKDGKAGLGIVEIKIPEETNECVAFVPADYAMERPHGIVIWLSPPGKFDVERMVERWQSICEERDLIVLAPQPSSTKRWQPTELDFVRKTLEELLRNYSIDENRIVVHGYQAGAAMAMRFAFDNRQIVRGVAAVGAGIPRATEIRGNDPADRLAFYFSWYEETRLAKPIAEGIKRLREFRFPVVTNIQTTDGYLTDDELSELARWIDTLDRL